jgi:Tfp pilus assembly protein PilF
MNWQWRVRHASGYRALGLWAEARAELALISAAHAHEMAVLMECAALSQDSGDWPQLVKTCERLVERAPDDAGWWIMWAYGVRRAHSLDAAEKILLQAASLHPADATIQFNLGCYACQLGRPEEARRRVERAIALDEKFRELAASDPDLEPLRPRAQ